MRILQVVHGFAPECRGGTENYVLEATLALRAAGNDVTVLAGSFQPRPRAEVVADEVDGIPVRRLHRAGLFLDRWEKSYDPTAALLFESVLDEVKPEVVHVHHWIRLTRNLVEITASRGIPAVVTLHDAMVSCPRVFRVREETLCHRPISVASCLDCVPRSPGLDDADCSEEIEAYRRDFERELDLASALIVPSRAHQDFLSRELGRPTASFRVIPHGMLERDRPERLPAAPRGERIRLGHWGHLEPYKGYHLLLEALHALGEEERRRFEVVCFGVASDPEYRKRLDELSKGLAVTEVGAFVPKTLASVPFDLAVIPSLASESFSFVLDEAFELGVPALVSDRGALAERIGGAGATFAAESPSSLAARLREVLADPEVLDRWRAAIPSLVPMADHAANLARIYRGAIRHGRQPVPVDPRIAAERLARVARRLEDRTQALDQARALAARRLEELSRKDADVGAFGQSIEDHRKIVAQKDAAIAEFSGSVAEFEAEIARRDAEAAKIEKGVAEIRRQVASLTGALSKKDSVIAEFERSIGEYKTEIERRDRSVSEIRAELARIHAQAEKQVAERTLAEKAWKHAMEEHERSIALHAQALATQAETLEATRRKVEQGLVEARSLSVELSEIQAKAAVAQAARVRAEADATALDAARAEEQRHIERWRGRALRSESAMTAVSATLDAATDTLAGLRRDLDDVKRRTDQLEDDARRIDALAAQGAAALSLPERTDGNRVLRASDLVGAVLAQQAKIREVRSWLGSANGSGRAAEVLRRLDAIPRPLRILLVIHDFLPYHAAGSEVYTYQLAKALAARHEVELVFCENRPERPQYDVRRGSFDGLPYTEIVHHDTWPSFRSTYQDSRMEARFDDVLARFRPDVVHVQHTKFFGVGILETAARRGIPVVCTLHEYMLLCARDGQMLRESLERCDLPDPATCAECMAPRLFESGSLSMGVQKVGRGLSRVLPGALKQVGTRIERRAAVRHAGVVVAEQRLALIEERNRVVREALGHVDLFLAPSEFLRRTFVASGVVPSARIVVSRYGQDLSRFRDAPRKRTGTLRVGYLGTVAAYKGVHVLVDALNRLAAHPVEGRIHGVTEFFPEFVEDLRSRITNPRVRILGRYDNQDVGRILSEMDVLVVPSLWWENSPITIHEAFLAGVPVIASDQGGMAELVQDGTNGFLFKVGDAADLARVLMRFVADPTLVEKLVPRRETIRDIVEDAAWTEGQYRRLIAARAAAT